MKAAPLKRAPTIVLKTIIVLIGLLVLVLCVLLFPQMWTAGAWEKQPDYVPVLWSAMIGLYASAIPFFIALWQTLRLLHRIDKNQAFSESSVQSLRIIKWCAVGVSACYAAVLPLVFVLAQLDDAPGLVLIGTAVAASPLIVATFAAVLQTLVRSAIDLKTENDLTI